MLPFQDLLLRLENKELADEGYMKRDLALSCLVAFHHFNLERALGGLSLQQRKISFSDEEGHETMGLTIFPGLADYQYQAILHYAKTEKWPFTSQGLFFALKRNEERRDPSLLEAFSLTPEFHAVFTLFSRTGTPLPREVVIGLLADGEWEPLAHFTEEQRKMQDLSVDKRRQFLQGYIQSGSKLALHLLFRTDREFVSKKFTDDQVLALLDVLDNKTPGFTDFVTELLTSVRTDAVLKKAGAKLYLFAGEPLPEPYEHDGALRRFAPHVAKLYPPPPPLPPPPVPTPPTPIKAAPQKITHVIEDGDSLWKIARKYHTTVEAIMKCNNLETEKLRVGRKLEIPAEHSVQR